MTDQSKPLNPSGVQQVIPLRAGSMRVPRTFAALSHRNYRLWFIGQLISLAGTWMQNIAQGWLVYELSHSTLMLGIVGFAAAIPVLIMAPWAGVVADRLPRRNLLVVTQTSAMLLAFILAALTFSGLVQVWHVVLMAVGLGLVNAFDAPARQSFIVDMVGREDLSNAIALNSIMFNSARIIGPAIAGLLLAAVGSAWCFFINGLSFLAVIICLLAMRMPKFQPKPTHESPWQQLVSGLVYVRTHTALLGIISLALIFSVFGMSYTTLLPAYAQQVLGVGAAGYGFITAASGVGAVTGAFVVASLGDRGRRGRWLDLANLAFPFILLSFAFISYFPVALLFAFGLGVGFMLQFTLFNTLLQTNVDDDMRGRVISLYTLSFFGFSPFGSLAIGQLAQVWGVSQTIALSALVALLLSRLVLLKIPQIRKLP